MSQLPAKTGVASVSNSAADGLNNKQKKSHTNIALDALPNPVSNQSDKSSTTAGSSAATNAEQLKMEKKTSKEIDAFLEEERLRFERLKYEPRILILGTSDSGKSTLIKQLKIMHGSGFSKEENYFYTNEVYRNIYTICITLFENTHSVKQDPRYAPLAQFCEEAITHQLKGTLQSESAALVNLLPPEDVLTLFSYFWDEEEISACLDRASDIQLQDTVKYFVSNAARILSKGYSISHDDILQLRTVTQGVSEFVYKNPEGNGNMRFYDVSGLKHHRKQWMGYFTDVHAILFVVSLSCYDQMMSEDRNTNRMEDAIKTFEQIANHPLLQKPNLILFLNKKDLLAEKLKKKNIQPYFPTFIVGKKGAHDSAISFFKKFFLGTVKKEIDMESKKMIQKIVLVHATCCTDTKGLSVILPKVLESIIRNKLEDVGIA